MKILYIVNDLDFFNSHRLPLAVRAIEEGHQVALASNKIDDNSKLDLDYFKINIHRSDLNLIKNLVTLFQITKIIKNFKPDLVHNITLKPILFSSLILFFNKNIISINAITGLGFLFTSKRKSFTKKSVLFFLKIIIKSRNSYYIFQNDIDLEQFKKLGLKKNYTVIKGSGVDEKVFKFEPEPNSNKIIIVFTGRILKDKGVFELIQAVKLLPNYIKDKIVLKIYGKIDLLNPSYVLESDLIKLLKKDFIIWEGFTNDIKNTLIKCNIYCFPSYREGLPKSIVEAMATGRPVVTTTAPGCDDTVIEGYNGFKVPVKNSKVLSKKLQLLIEDDELRVSMGKNSRSFFKKEFTLEKVISHTFDFYNHALKVI